MQKPRAGALGELLTRHNQAMTYVHINIPKGHYIGQVRKCGYRRFETVTQECETMERALSLAGERMKGQHRLRVLFIDDSGYYEPHVCFEGSR